MNVSVVIPCFNVESHLANCLEKVFEQNDVDVQLICVDDGSTDGTLTELKRLQEKRQFEILEGENQGACAARNKGLAHCDSEYVQFLDADDELMQGKLSDQIALATAAKADVVVAAYQNKKGTGILESVRPLENEWLALIQTRMGTTSANLWRRETLQRIGGWNESLSSSQDYELLFRVLKNGGVICNDDEIRATILKREIGSISQTDKFDNWKRYIQLREEIQSYLSAQNGYSQELEVLEQYFFMAIRVLAQYDIQYAIKEYNRLISRGFVPKLSAAISKRYVFLFRLFGFARAESLIKALKPDLYSLE